MDKFLPQSKNANTRKNKTLKDSSNLQTTEGIDKNTRLLLFKLQNLSIISKINGIIGQGKESFVFHSLAEDGETSLATKIYKTTKIEFKNRDIYIEGDWRFRDQTQLQSQNPRKIIPLWAEKEFKNLSRLTKFNIPCPRPIHLKKHIVVMEFIGLTNELPAPRLSTAILAMTSEERGKMYWQCVTLLRRLYHEAELVHSDFCAFNLLVRYDELVVIDLAQAVSPSHKYSTHFLRRDCKSVTNFFSQKFVPSLTTRDLYEHVISHEPLSQEELLLKCRDLTQTFTDQERIEELIWMNMDIPQSLKDIIDPLDIKEGSVYESSVKTLVGSDKK